MARAPAPEHPVPGSETFHNDGLSTANFRSLGTGVPPLAAGAQSGEPLGKSLTSTNFQSLGTGVMPIQTAAPVPAPAPAAAPAPPGGDAGKK